VGKTVFKWLLANQGQANFTDSSSGRIRLNQNRKQAWPHGGEDYFLDGYWQEMQKPPSNNTSRKKLKPCYKALTPINKENDIYWPKRSSPGLLASFYVRLITPRSLKVRLVGQVLLLLWAKSRPWLCLGLPSLVLILDLLLQLLNYSTSSSSAIII